MDAIDRTELPLEEVALMFLTAWKLWSLLRHHGGTGMPFEETEVCKKFIARGLIATHLNPRAGDYEVQYKYTGVIFFTGKGELVFSSAIFAGAVAEAYVSNGSGRDIQVKKVVAEY